MSHPLENTDDAIRQNNKARMNQKFNEMAGEILESNVSAHDERCPLEEPCECLEIIIKKLAQAVPGQSE